MFKAFVIAAMVYAIVAATSHIGSFEDSAQLVQQAQTLQRIKQGVSQEPVGEGRRAWSGIPSSQS